jgi:hypothetical protein
MTASAEVDWIFSESDGESSFRWGYANDDVIAEWGGILSLRASRNGELKALFPYPGASQDRVEKTRRGRVNAFLRARRHQPSLHASAVSMHGRALLCVGDSGLGKSTAAERLCHHPGVALLADDTASIEILPGGALEVQPTESSVWLSSGSSLNKRSFGLVSIAIGPAVPSCVVALAFDCSATDVRVSELRGANAVEALLPSIIRFDTDPLRRTGELEFLDLLISQTRVLRVSRSEDVSADLVAKVLLKLLLPG